MAGGVPVVYRKTGESSIASYSFYDLAAGTGYKTFYGVNLIETSTAKYSLSVENIGSLDSYTAFNNSTSDMDFDLSVEQHMTLEGNALINTPILITRVAASTTVNTTIYVKLYKVRNAVETQLGTTATKTYSDVLESGVYAWHNFTCRIVIPTTQLKPGDTLRMNVSTDANGANNYVYIFHDPKGYDEVSATYTKSTIMLASIPLKINL